MMMAASAKSEQSDEKKAGKGHPASVSKEGSPHGQMPESMKEAMKKMGANMDPEKAMEMAKSMGASPEALKKMEAGMKANKETVETRKASRYGCHDGRYGKSSERIQ